MGQDCPNKAFFPFTFSIYDVLIIGQIMDIDLTLT